MCCTCGRSKRSLTYPRHVSNSHSACEPGASTAKKNPTQSSIKHIHAYHDTHEVHNLHNTHTPWCSQDDDVVEKDADNIPANGICFSRLGGNQVLQPLGCLGLLHPPRWLVAIASERCLIEKNNKTHGNTDGCLQRRQVGRRARWREREYSKGKQHA